MCRPLIQSLFQPCVSSNVALMASGSKGECSVRGCLHVVSAPVVVGTPAFVAVHECWTPRRHQSRPPHLGRDLSSAMLHTGALTACSQSYMPSSRRSCRTTHPLYQQGCMHKPLPHSTSRCTEASNATDCRCCPETPRAVYIVLIHPGPHRKFASNSHRVCLISSCSPEMVAD